MNISIRRINSTKYNNNLLFYKKCSIVKLKYNKTKCRVDDDNLEKKVFLISHKHNDTLWGWHMENYKTDGAFKCQIVVFQCKNDAKNFANKIWIHKLIFYKWPETILEYKPFQLIIENNYKYSGNNKEYIYPSLLQVEEVDLISLIYKMSLSCAGVKLINSFVENNDDFNNLNGKYLQINQSMNEKIKWLNEIWNKDYKK